MSTEHTIKLKLDGREISKNVSDCFLNQDIGEEPIVSIVKINSDGTTTETDIPKFINGGIPMEHTNRQTTINAIVRKLQWLDDKELSLADAMLRNMLLTERKKNDE